VLEETGPVARPPAPRSSRLLPVVTVGQIASGGGLIRAGVLRADRRGSHVCIVTIAGRAVLKAI
jgi:hypothetical protein